MANRTELKNEVHEYLNASEFTITKKDTDLVIDAVLDSIQDLTVRDGKFFLK